MICFLCLAKWKCLSYDWVSHMIYKHTRWEKLHFELSSWQCYQHPFNSIISSVCVLCMRLVPSICILATYIEAGLCKCTYFSSLNSAPQSFLSTCGPAQRSQQYTDIWIGNKPRSLQNMWVYPCIGACTVAYLTNRFCSGICGDFWGNVDQGSI